MLFRSLEAGIIYPIADSRWVSPVHCVPKKGGVTIVPNENNELIPQRTVVGYRMCIDFVRSIKLLRKIIILCLLLIKCWKGCLRTLIFVTWMVILVSLKFMLENKTKTKPLLLVRMELLLIDVCLLVCVMLLLCFKDADRKSTRLNSSHSGESRMPSSA